MSLAALYRRGADLDWSAVNPRGNRVPLPGHPLRRIRVTPPAAPSARAPHHPAVPSAITPKERTVPDELLAEVRRLTSEKLGRPAADVAPDSSFFELGADSLSLMGMTAELEQRYGVRVPVRELFDSADTPRALAERLAQLGKGLAGGSVEVPPEPGLEPRQEADDRRQPQPAPAPALAATPAPAPAAEASSGLHELL
ncbi:acyl carrier protein, partial [Streptomyces mutomycini]